VAKANEIEIVVRGKDDSEVTITRSTKRAEEAAERIRRSGERASQGLDRTRDSADGAADGLTRVGEAGDVTDTRMLGMSNLFGGLSDTMEGTAEVAKGNLLNGFYLLGLGIADLGSGVYNFVVPSLQAAKGAMTTTAATAVETAATETVAAGERATAQTAAAGTTVAAQSRMRAAMAATATVAKFAWAPALLAAGAVIGTLVARTMRVNAAAEQLRSTLDENTGAATMLTRENIALAMSQEALAGWDKSAKQAADELGISTRDLVDATLGKEEALRRVSKALDEADARQARLGMGDSHNATLVRRAMAEQSEAVEKAKEIREDLTEAVEENTGAYRRNANELRKQIDPIFAFLDAQDSLTDAQKEYTAAVKKHGRNSSEAEKANRDLARAQFDLMAAAEALAGNFNGKLTPSQRQTLKAAGATEAQLRDLERQLARTKKSAEAYAKTYRARIVTIYETTGQRVAGITGSGGHAMAHGGISGAAGGGPRGGLTWVGEQGPELVDLAPGSTVIPAGTSANMAAAGGGPVQVIIQFERTGVPIQDALIAFLSEHIRVRHGGNVQEALGT